ncbi:hypothetical protein K458DRAFT_245957, partial [Lentithecium fluviatile CBS 122367]
IHPLLRQRMLNRAATFAEGSQHPIPPLPRRRSSVYSNTQHSIRSSTDNLLRTNGHNDMDKLTNSDEPSFWHSAPLAFAVVPAFAGLLFQNGGAVVTDILLLGFGSMFLNWCLRTPWEWYHSAQQTQYVDLDEAQHDDTILEEDEGSDGSKEDDTELQQSTASTAPELSHKTEKEATATAAKAQHDAYRELQRNEMLALVACFLGPLAGAYFLHTIRSQLTRPAEGLVSNFNLTIFVMAAELRPVSHIIKMKQARMLHLQRVVRSDGGDSFRKADIQELSNRLADLESRAAEPAHNADIDTIKMGASVRQSMQPQLDALNRAVRRYEKRQAAISMQTEARFQELDSRLKDVLALAAAAARTGQRPGVISMVFSWVANVINYTLQTSWAIATSPFRTAAAIASSVQAWFIKTNRQPRKRVKGQSNGASSIPPSKLQSRAIR